jgi:SIR2-like domain
MLARVLQMRTTVAFLGSGCSNSLGYPSWTELAAGLIRKTLAISEVRSSPLHERLRSFGRRLHREETAPSEDLKFYIAMCQRAIPPNNPTYREYFEKQFGKRTVPLDAPNPYRVLLRLPIYRFITTNYDVEIERVLHQERNISFPELGHEFIVEGKKSPVGSRSFTQRHEDRDQLALFSIARGERADHMVFHCHGRFDDLDSIIATESDYQRWYLTDEDGGAFRRTIEILFGSNPILFIGYGLGDEDMMRHLRILSALDPDRKHSRPLFALLPEEKDEENWDQHEHLYDRYGLNVIPFTMGRKLYAIEKGRILYGEIQRLVDELPERRQKWLEKPFFRKIYVPVQPPEPYYHSGLEPESGQAASLFSDQDLSLAASRIREKVQGLLGVSRDSHILVLVGPGGTGKSWHAVKLMEACIHASREDPLDGQLDPYDGFFFWRSYYADDALSGLDRLLSYLGEDDEKAKQIWRLERLENRLTNKPLDRDKVERYLIIFDGFERLLQQVERSDEGEVISKAIERFVEIFVHPECRSTLVLTSTLWPRMFNDNNKFKNVKRLSSERLPTEVICEDPPFRECNPKSVSALCSLLDGHAYAIVLAARLLQRDDPRARLDQLLHSLARTPPDRRVSRVIEEVIKDCDRDLKGYALALLERLSIFMSPGAYRTCEICLQSAKALFPSTSNRAPELDDILRSLVQSRLLFRIDALSGAEKEASYAVHPTVRRFVFERVHGVEKDVFPSFTLSGLTSGTAAVHPGTRDSADVLRDVFNRLLEAAYEARKQGQKREAEGYCRALFSAMRSRMESNTASRWTSYDDYLSFGLRLADLAKLLSPRLWTYREKHEIALVEHREAPLYADELAWLYNDIGLTLCAEGQMADSYAVWEQGYEINRIIEGSSQIPRYTLQSQLHLAHTFLELGRLRIADQFLDDTEKTNDLVDSDDYKGRILGYRAILAHLHADFEEAGRLYRRAFRLLDKTRNARAKSFFLSHRVGLEIRMGHLEEALVSARTSRALADTEHYPDLVAYARLATGKVLRNQGMLSEATMEFYSALEEARQLGIGRLEAEVLVEFSKLALGLGDVEIARQRALDSLQVANALELGLRQVTALVALGPATAKAGYRELGIAYLKHARSLAIQQECWLRKQEAEEHLRMLGSHLSLSY